MKQIPNLFTLLNLVFGCCAIVFLLQNGISVFYRRQRPRTGGICPKKYGWLLCLSVSQLLLISWMALLPDYLKRHHAMGKQLDSLADL